MSRLASAFIFLCLAPSLLGQADGLLEQADAAFRSGDPDRAVTLARQVLAKDPEALHAHMILGVVAAQREQWQAAERHFQAVIRFAPSDPQGYFYLGQASLYRQEWAKAARYFAKAQELGYPDRDRLTVELAVAQNEHGRPQQALENLRKVRLPEGSPLAAQYHAVMASSLGKLNQPDRAIAAARRARDLDDSKAQYWGFLISSLIGGDQTTSALREAIRAQSKFPDDPEIQFLFGLASYYVTESSLTGLALRNLREAQPDGAEVVLLEGLQHRKQGRTQEATRAFGLAAKRGVPDAHLLLGIVQKEAGDYDAAEREYREAERLNPHNGQVLLELGKLFLSRGNFTEALARLEKAERYMPGVPAVHYHLGVVYGRLGQKEKAAQQESLFRQLEKEQADQLDHLGNR